MKPEDSYLRVRRSILIRARRDIVWEEFATITRMRLWWGAVMASAEAGRPNGMILRTYEPRSGGKVVMEVSMEGGPAQFGGPIVVFEVAREVTIENDWIPNRGWQKPTFITLRLSDAPGGTL